MSNRRNPGRNGIAGPQSALTDFLAANNISARQIRDNFEQRQRDAQQDSVDPEDPTPNTTAEVVQHASTDASTKKRKRSEKNPKAVAKAAAKSKKGKKEDFSDDSNSEYDLDFASTMYKKAKPNPGQLENCEECSKRFTVTPYSKTGPEGGLLCTPCGKLQTKDQKSEQKKVKAQPGRKRRQVESNRLDGLVHHGPKSLQDLCINKVAQHAGDIEEFGDMPDSILDRLSQIFSKKRVLDSKTFKLFLRPDLDAVIIHDAANLNEDDFKQIFAIVPNIKKLVLGNAGQFKDSVLQYLIEKAKNLSYFQIYGANLITNDVWIKFFKEYGHHLETVKIEWCDASFTDEVAYELATNCPNIQRLKFKYCRKLTAACLPFLGNLKKLEHLSLHLGQWPDSDNIISLVNAVGPQLRTLSMQNCYEADDNVINAIRSQCKNLTKFRLTHNDGITDGAIASLFAKDGDNPTVLPPLRFCDLSSNRDINNNSPDGPEDDPIGLATKSLISLMAHSGQQLRTLDISSCRHVSHAAFCDVFDIQTKIYPELHTINLTFCKAVDTSVIKGIFACCPSLKKIIAFGCFMIEHLVVPQGVAVIGVPRAQDAIEQFGEAGMDLDKALDSMNHNSLVEVMA